MNDRDRESGDRGLERLAGLLSEAPEIGLYTDIFPRLDVDHDRALAVEDRTPRPEAARSLFAAARGGPVAESAAVDIYWKLGELPALRRVADAGTVADAAIEWQRKVNELLGPAERRAAFLDDEGVECEGGQTWVKLVRGLRERLERQYPDRPAIQERLIHEFVGEMDRGLTRQKAVLERRLERARGDLERRRDALADDIARQAEQQAQVVREEIDRANLLIALRKLATLEGLVRGRASRAEHGGGGRLAPPRRINRFGHGKSPLQDLIRAVKEGHEGVALRRLREDLPDFAIEETNDPESFPHKQSSPHAGDWNRYFAALRKWFGRSEKADKDSRRLQTLRLPKLEPLGEKLPGRWTFLEATPWDGAPFLEDRDGRPRILAIVRVIVSESDRGRMSIVRQVVGETLRDLFDKTSAAESPAERQFRDEGLVLVLLPGDLLATGNYDQIRREMPLPGRSANSADRIAYLDELDLLRLVQVRADDRFKALLEISLPRFREALSQTYQNSDAVRSRMFFGRSDELAQLRGGTTVVFSGRKMGKSSLLHRLRNLCGQDTDQRAVLVGCSAVARGRSWLVLHEIERELARLMRAEGIEGVGSTAPAPFDAAPAEAMRAAQDRFRQVIEAVMQHMETRGVRQLYVLLDEADNFIRAEFEETSGVKEARQAVSWFLRELQTTNYPGRLRFIFAGYDQIGRVFRDPGLGHSAFGNWGGPPHRLGPLDEADARALIVQPLTALGMTVGDELAERILDYTSGHASLIQAFCRKLAERIKATRAAWPLEDVSVGFEDVQFVADDTRGAGDQGYRQLLEQTLGLNLDIARAYPLKLLFLSLASPTGLGSGRVLGAGEFSLADVVEQIRPGMGAGESMEELSETLLLDSLDLLAQLGLLEDASEGQDRAYRFKARHYVNVLRGKNGFRDQLRQAVEEWTRSTRRVAQAEPRYVWTLPDDHLVALRRLTPRPAVVVGLPDTGRTYLATMLSSPLPRGDRPTLLDRGRPEFVGRLTARLDEGGEGLTIVLDRDDAERWEDVRAWLARAEGAGMPLRWVGGARLGWDLAGDAETVLRIAGPYGLGPLTAAEIEPWTARELGDEGRPSPASVPEADRAGLIRLTGGLLPVLELFRKWLVRTYNQLPDPLRLTHARAYLDDLKANQAHAVAAARTLARGLPAELRAGLHGLFLDGLEWGDEKLSRGDLMGLSPYLEGLGADRADRLLDAADWVGLLPPNGASGYVEIPQDTLLGLLIRRPEFAAP